MKGKMKLGRKTYRAFRDTGGRYVGGLWVDGIYEEFPIRASIHGSLFWNRMKLTDGGDWSKESISVRSNERLYLASLNPDGTAGKRSDIIEWEGSFWEVWQITPYTNLPSTRHDETICVKLDEVPRIRGMNDWE